MQNKEKSKGSAAGAAPFEPSNDPRLGLRCIARPASAYAADCSCWKCSQARAALAATEGK